MELYTLDSLLRREQVVDKFESLIWTERYSAFGDFSLLINSTRESRSQFLKGTRVALNRSYRVMTVETIEDSIDEEGKFVLSVKGRSLEALLFDRVARRILADLAIEPKWVLTGIPGDIARQMFDHICRLGSLDPGDVIPFIQPGTIFPAGTIPEPSTPITWEQELESLYNAIKKLCDLYDLGFRIVRNFDMSQLYFEIYSGNDRTTRQTVLNPVIFSMSLDNLRGVTQLDTIQDSKNVAYVFSEFGHKVVYPDFVNPDIEGFERRVMYVEANNVTEDTPPGDIQEALELAGQQALSEARGFSGVDGELDEYGSYRYGIDYDLGDLVVMRNQDGVVSDKRVTEQIFVCDKEGERSYPTLTMNQFITDNTWLSQPSDKVWEDFTTEHWIDMQ